MLLAVRGWCGIYLVYIGLAVALNKTCRNICFSLLLLPRGRRENIARVWGRVRPCGSVRFGNRPRKRARLDIKWTVSLHTHPGIKMKYFCRPTNQPNPTSPPPPLSYVVLVLTFVKKLREKKFRLFSSLLLCVMMVGIEEEDDDYYYCFMLYMYPKSLVWYCLPAGMRMTSTIHVVCIVVSIVLLLISPFLSFLTVFFFFVSPLFSCFR